MRLLVTRPEPDTSRLKQQLEALGHGVVLEPLLTIEFEHAAPIDLSGIRALIVTSRNALRALAPDLASSPALDAARSLPLFVVGEGSGELAREMGFCKLYVADGAASDLPGLIATTLPPSGSPLLHLAGAKLAVDLEEPLRRAGYTYQKETVYRAVPSQQFSPETVSLFQSGEIDGVILMSPRTANIYSALITSAQLADFARKMIHFCLSDAIASQLTDLKNLSVQTTAQPKVEEMLALIAACGAKRS